MVEAKLNNKLIYSDPSGDHNGKVETENGHGDLTFDFSNLGNGSNYVRVSGALMANRNGTKDYRDFRFGKKSERTFTIQGKQQFTLKLHANPFEKQRVAWSELKSKVRAQRNNKIPYPFPSH